MKILFLAYYFPPESSSGSFRPLYFANHLTELGDEIHVITSRPEDYLPAQPQDENLLNCLNSKVHVTRCSTVRPREALLRIKKMLYRKRDQVPNSSRHAADSGIRSSMKSKWQLLKDLITDLLATPDPQVGWIPACVSNGHRIIKEWQPDCLIATAGPWSATVAGAILAKVTGIPLVLDFRDPWTSNPYHSLRSPLLQRFDKYMERFAVGNAALIISNTEPLREDFLLRYPSMLSNQVVTITNGFEDFLPRKMKQKDEVFTLVHAGALYHSRNPAPFLKAVKQLLSSSSIDPKKLKIFLVGGIERPDEEVACLLASPELREVVHTTPRVSHTKALAYMQEADALLLIQPGFPMQIPRKLYEYMAACKPVLCIGESDGATARLIREHGMGLVSDQCSVMIVEALTAMIEEHFSDSKNCIVDNTSTRFCNRELTIDLRKAIAKFSIKEDC